MRRAAFCHHASPSFSGRQHNLVLKVKAWADKEEITKHDLSSLDKTRKNKEKQKKKLRKHKEKQGKAKEA